MIQRGGAGTDLIAGIVSLTGGGDASARLFGL